MKNLNGAAALVASGQEDQQSATADDAVDAHPRRLISRESAGNWVMGHMRSILFALALGTFVVPPQHLGIPIPEVGAPMHAYNGTCSVLLQAVVEAQYWVDYWEAEIASATFVPAIYYVNYQWALADLSRAIADYNWHCQG